MEEEEEGAGLDRLAWRYEERKGGGEDLHEGQRDSLHLTTVPYLHHPRLSWSKKPSKVCT
jgi:hypothetical protein